MSSLNSLLVFHVHHANLSCINRIYQKLRILKKKKLVTSEYQKSYSEASFQLENLIFQSMNHETKENTTSQCKQTSDASRELHVHTFSSPDENSEFPDGFFFFGVNSKISCSNSFS